MVLRNTDAWGMACALSGQPLDGHLDLMHEPWRGIISHLKGVPVGDRLAALRTVLVAFPNRDEIVRAIAAQKPTGPAPVAEPVRYATMADVARVVSTQAWLWDGWIARGVLNALASDPGVGKTRFALDLARRLFFALPLPDGQVNPFPAGTGTLWVQGDRNFAETLRALRDFGLPDEAVALGSSPDEPFGSLDLDDPTTLAAIGQRIEAAGVPLAIIDTVGMVTSRNLSRPDEAREFFAPILEMCQRTGVALLGLTHLSANKEALGRRIVEKARVVLKMTQPDPEGQKDRRKLWVDKTAVVKPPALGITMASAGNEYDTNPPTEPEPLANRPGRPPAKLDACKTWLADQLRAYPVRVKDLRQDADAAGFSTPTLYAAMKALPIAEYSLEGKRWWRLTPNP